MARLGRHPHLVVQVGASADAGERHRQARLLLPPVAEIDHLHQAVIGVGEATLVDDQSGVHVAVRDRPQDPVVAQLHER